MWVHADKLIFDSEAIDYMATIDCYVQFIIYESSSICFKFPTPEEATRATEIIGERVDYDCVHAILPNAASISQQEFDNYLVSINEKPFFIDAQEGE